MPTLTLLLSLPSSTAGYRVPIWRGNPPLPSIVFSLPFPYPLDLSLPLFSPKRSPLKYSWKIWGVLSLSGVWGWATEIKFGAFSAVCLKIWHLGTNFTNCKNKYVAGCRPPTYTLSTDDNSLIRYMMHNHRMHLEMLKWVRLLWSRRCSIISLLLTTVSIQWVETINQCLQQEIVASRVTVDCKSSVDVSDKQTYRHSLKHPLR